MIGRPKPPPPNVQLDRVERLVLDIRKAQIAFGETLAAVSRSNLKIEEITMADQASLDALTARVDAATTAITTGVTDIRADIADLKAANPGVDTTALEASVAKLEGEVADVTELDGENPAPAAPVV